MSSGDRPGPPDVLGAFTFVAERGKIQIDPSFRDSGKIWRQRRRRRRTRAIVAGVVAAVLVVGAGIWLLAGWGASRVVTGDRLDEGGEDPVFVQTEDTVAASVIVIAAAAEVFLDIRGDPMILNLPEGTSSGVRRVIALGEIDPLRARAGATLSLMETGLLDDRQRVQVTLPSSSADLAAFQARRSVGTQRPVSGGGADNPAEAGGVAGGSDRGADTGITEVSTTVVPVLRAAARATLFRDSVKFLEKAQPLAGVLTGQGVEKSEVARIISALTRLAADASQPVEQMLSLPQGSLVALRLAPARRNAVVLQMSIYAPTGYLMSMAQPGPGRFVSAADPWYSARLLDRAGRALRARGSSGKLRLKDAVYSTLLRNGIPPELVGEMMVMLARVQDLDEITDERDRIRLLYNKEGRGVPAGRLLYAALDGPSLSVRCYVIRPAAKDAPYGCFDPKRPSGGAPAGSGAIRALANRIVQVESAGNARAKNTRSSATGLGQFITGTWIRMMTTYRPDLVASLDRQELLDLRFDPVMSRTMVTNLARENASFLRSRGHEITPGRLYLAHFLGPAGAARALSADPTASVAEVMGEAVVGANPALKDWTVGQMIAWSNRKMGKTDGGVAVAAPVVVSKDVSRFREAVDRFFAEL